MQICSFPVLPLRRGPTGQQNSPSRKPSKERRGKEGNGTTDNGCDVDSHRQLGIWVRTQRWHGWGREGGVLVDWVSWPVEVRKGSYGRRAQQRGGEGGGRREAKRGTILLSRTVRARCSGVGMLRWRGKGGGHTLKEAFFPSARDKEQQQREGGEKKGKNSAEYTPPIRA